MKDYKEIAAEVFARRDEYLIKQKKRRKAVASAASLCAVLCVVIGVAVGYRRLGGEFAVDVTDSSGEEILSLMNTPTIPSEQPDTAEPTYNEPPVHGFSTSTGDGKGYAESDVTDRAGAAQSDRVVYATVERFQQIGTDIICTLTVEKTLKGEEADTVSFNISEEDREDFMALIKGEKGVFFLSEGEHGLVLTHGGSSIFYEAGEDDYRSYDETGLICYYLTMEEIENITEAGA